MSRKSLSNIGLTVTSFFFVLPALADEGTRVIRQPIAAIWKCIPCAEKASELLIKSWGEGDKVNMAEVDKQVSCYVKQGTIISIISFSGDYAAVRVLDQKNELPEGCEGVVLAIKLED